MVKKSSENMVPEVSRAQAFREMLRQKRLKVTSARLAVLEVLANSRHPLTHAEVQAVLKDQVIDPSSIFRNLHDLAEVGLVNRTELGDHVWRFELVQDNHAGSHPHFVCEDCGSVTCLPEAALELDAQRKVEGVGTISQVLLKGQCEDCADKAEPR